LTAALVWFGVAPIGSAYLGRQLIGDPSVGAVSGAVAILIAGLVSVLPFAFLAVLGRRRGWAGIAAAASALAVASGYVILEAGIRLRLPQREALMPLRSHYAAAGLRVAVLVPYAGLAAWLTPRLAGAPARPIGSWLGLGRPRWSTCFLALAAAALVTIPWPVTGALGDSLTAIATSVQTLASVIPEMLVFWGVLFGLLTAVFARTEGAAAMTMLIYSLSTIGGVLPDGDAGTVVNALLYLPLAFMLAEMRARGGNVLPLLGLALVYRLGPSLFMDPRDVIAQGIPEVQHVLGYGVVLVVATMLALVLWLGRRVAKRRRGEGPRGRGRGGAGRTLGMALVLAAAWGLWVGLYVAAGEPGFFNHGFLIVMEEQANLELAYEVQAREDRKEAVYQALVETAQESQEPIRDKLDDLGIPYRSYYIVNMIRVDGHRWLMGRFKDRPRVAGVILNPNVRRYPRRIPIPAGAEGAAHAEDNLGAINVGTAWELGVRGQGIVVGGQDSGYDWDHPALRAQYRGWNGERVEHDYNWHDAWDDTEEPFDDGMHGTHTMGTVLGDDGGENSIGVAPGATWIGCRNMRRGLGNPGTYAACMEFLLAPYPQGGDPFREGDVGRAADVINNSWGCPRMEGCLPDTLRPAVEALHAAGIMMVVSAGNDGPACGTTTTPPANYDAAFSVGATTAEGDVTGFSSRGPVGGRVKPDISAPGFLVRSSVPDGSYGTAGGTSMAGPHVTGAVALVWSADASLIGDIDATEEVLCRTARPRPVSQSCAEVTIPRGPLAAVMNPPACACGGVSGVPNNVYGCGLVDAGAAVEAALGE
jgi:subtilisin family serine protease